MHALLIFKTTPNPFSLSFFLMAVRYIMGVMRNQCFSPSPQGNSTDTSVSYISKFIVYAFIRPFFFFFFLIVLSLNS